MTRSRIVFNRALRGECNFRAFEAVAAGALLFQERGSREVPALLADRCECVYYGEDDLETLLEHYLDREEERATIAAAARGKLTERSDAGQWAAPLDGVATELPALRPRAAERLNNTARQEERTPHAPREEILTRSVRGTYAIARSYSAREKTPSFEARVWQAASGPAGAAAEVAGELEQAVRSGPRWR